ncbi:hypothetical protein [Paraliobacillus zengyii]|uniref:hypothetical protein n=1 Tax=Paraliobacillus zengyii TaxID=2213194 RepID=UPI000E3EB814|nr:hypothetical protein [Paraliobacillus zengyii]
MSDVYQHTDFSEENDRLYIPKLISILEIAESTKDNYEENIKDAYVKLDYLELENLNMKV